MQDRQQHRYRWHPLAIASAAMVAIVFALVNLPGSLVVSPEILSNGQYGPHFDCYDCLKRGWPLTFLSHYGEGAWISIDSFEYSAWRIGDVISFEPMYLLLDAVLAVAITFAAGSLVNRRLKTRGLQFSLLEFFIIVVITSLSIGYLVDRWRLHQSEIAFLRKLGDSDPSFADWQPFGPFWLRTLTGDRFWSWGDHLVGLDIHHSDQLADIPRKQAIEVLRIQTVSSETMPVLVEFPRLRALDLFMINYDYGDVPDGEEPEFWRSLRAVGRCSSLEGLNLYDTGATNRGLAELAGLKRLMNLELSANLEITDEGLVHLKSLSGLRELGLCGTSITAAGVADLQRSLPHCKIAWDRGEEPQF